MTPIWLGAGRRVECRGIPLKPKPGLNGAPSWICRSKFKNLRRALPVFFSPSGLDPIQRESWVPHSSPILA
jgi:hypothetical protein